ncbi:DUF4286 family protein [Flavobacterium agricola]|uniref:DUF4286 family protein n=1 Tax=Flavobacterium agricola TaxID=2870839 RepID=A0ABY6M0E9_9FLAO|nr:DUF4286 family protein [Flavobacterium agricola]UYW01149.1 DUF4286 family protein [Flavobacterium agricola]
MIIYNITMNIDESVHEKWMDWMKNSFIKQMLETEHFSAARMVKVIVNEEMGGLTYSTQFETESRETLENFYNQDHDRLLGEGHQLFADKMLVFATELAVLEEF